MSPDVSRALGQVKSRLQLGLAATDDLLQDFGSALSVEDLPRWIRQLIDEMEGE